MGPSRLLVLATAGALIAACKPQTRATAVDAGLVAPDVPAAPPVVVAPVPTVKTPQVIVVMGSAAVAPAEASSANASADAAAPPDLAPLVNASELEVNDSWRGMRGGHDAQVHFKRTQANVSFTATISDTFSGAALKRTGVVRTATLNAFIGALLVHRPDPSVKEEFSGHTDDYPQVSITAKSKGVDLPFVLTVDNNSWQWSANGVRLAPDAVPAAPDDFGRRKVHQQIEKAYDALMEEAGLARWLEELGRAKRERPANVTPAPETDPLQCKPPFYYDAKGRKIFKPQCT